MPPNARRFTETTHAVLTRAGWFEGRNVADRVREWAGILSRDGFRIFPAAEEVLREFGGISIQQRGPGLTAARESFAFDPTAARLEDDRFAAFNGQAGSALYPLGEHGQGFLAIAEDGRVFVLMDEMVQLGRTIDDALEAMIQGLRGTPVEGHADWDIR
jgi:hypothetical protein